LSFFFLGGKEILSFDGGKSKKSRKGKTTLKSKDITLLQIYKRDTLTPQLIGIETFVTGVLKSKYNSSVIRSHNRIVLQTGTTELALKISGEEQLYFLVALLLVQSDMGKKPDVKKKYSWVHKNINSILFHEVRIALRSCNSTIASILLEKFNNFPSEEEESSDLLRCYSVGLFAPILKQGMLKSTMVSMAPYQKDFANKIIELINLFVRCITEENEWPQFPKALFNLNTFGSGKTTIGAIATAHGLDKANEVLGEDSRVIGVFTLPSLQTSVSFASVVAMDQPTWIIQRGKIMPLHKFCPHYNIRKGRRLFLKVERWADFQGSNKEKFRDGLDLKAPLLDQVKMLLDWTPEFSQNGKDYVFGHREYKKPVVIFADSESALQLNQSANMFKEQFGWHFLNIIDEFPATADCNFELHENELLQNVVKIIQCRNKFNILMSASPTVDQVSSTSLFNDWECSFAELSITTRSFTQLYYSDGRPVHPLQGLSPETFHAVKNWNDTDFRFFPPTTFLALCDHLKEIGHGFDVSINDVENQDNLIKAIRRMCLFIADLDDASKQSICELNVKAEIPNISNESSLTLTTGNLEDEILNSLAEKTTHEKVERYFEEYKSRISNEIQEVQNEISSSSLNKEKSIIGSKDSLLQKIENLNLALENVKTHEVTITTNLGTATISFAWYETYSPLLSDDQLAVVLSGLDVEFENRLMNTAIKEVVKKPRKVIDTITSMYGRNDHRTKNVFIKDPNHMIGFDTMKQALARAGRDGMTPVVSGMIDEHLLPLFRPNSKTSIPSMEAASLTLASDFVDLSDVSLLEQTIVG